MLADVIILNDHVIIQSPKLYMTLVRCYFPYTTHCLCRISDWPGGRVNRPVKTNTQTFIKFTQRHCQTVVLSGQNSGTAAPTDNFESQFKIHERKLRSKNFPSLLQV